MAAPRVLILRAPGTNCDEETAFAFARAGGVPAQLHVNRVLENAAQLSDFEILCLPGGFSYGDDIAAGRIFATQIRHHLADVLNEFCEAGKLILGICNGFQVLLQTGLLAEETQQPPPATLAWNDSGRFEDRWVRLHVTGTNCAFLAGIDEMELPVAHAEGKFVARDAKTFHALDQAGQLVLRYASTSDRGDVAYPDNPNGSQGHVAGMCHPQGRIMGLMPHPERFIASTQHPRWTREPWRDTGDGLALFQNAVRYFL